MSSSGQGDQIDEMSKDEDGEISSTTPDHGGGVLGVEDVSGLTKPAAEEIMLDADSTVESSEPSANADASAAPVSPTGVGDFKVASTTAACNKDDDATAASNMNAEICSKNTEDVTDIENLAPEVHTDMESKLSLINETCENLANKNSSSLAGDLELALKKNDDVTDETAPTADVLQQLDLLIGNMDVSDKNPEDDKTEIYIEKPESVTGKFQLESIESQNNFDSNNSDKTIRNLKSYDCNNDKYDTKMTSGNDSKKNELITDKNILINDNSQVLDCDDLKMTENASFNKALEINMDISITQNIEKPKQSDPVFTRNISDQDIFMEKDDITEEPCKSSIIKEVEIISEFTLKDVQMDVDTEIISENSKVEESLKEVMNKDMQPEICGMEVTYEIDKADGDKFEELTNVAVKDSITPSDNSSVSLPMEVSAISDRPVESQNIDCQTSRTSLEAPIEPEVSTTDTQDDNKKMNSNIQNVDEYISQITNDSILDSTITPNIHHRINEPNVMLDIPTQELSDIEAELDDDGDLEQYHKKVNRSENTPKSPENSSKIDKHLSDIDMIELKDQKDIPDDITLKSTTLETVETDAGLSKQTVSPMKSDLMQDPSSLMHDSTSTPKSPTVIHEIEDENTVTSKLQQKIEEKPLTHEIDEDKPSTSKMTLKIVDDKPSTTESTQMIEENPLTSKSTQKIDGKPSSSKSTKVIDDEKPSTSESMQVIVDEKPSTSRPYTSSSEQMADNTDNAEEAADSLGLLAESSRVMDDDNDDDEDPEVEDHDEDPEADDNDDEDDFDPYEETNSEMAEDMEEPTTPPSDLDPKMDKPEPSPKVQEERESDEGTMDIAEGSIDIVDDIECEENDLSEMEIPDVVLEPPFTENAEKDEPEIIDADTHVEKKKSSPSKVTNILENILGGLKKVQANNIRTFVELDGSSDSDDVLEVSKPDASNENVVSVNIPKGVEVMSTSGPCSTSEILSKEGEVIISGVPKPPPHKMSKINTSEVSIKRAASSNPSIHIPETISPVKTKTGKDEIFNLDSDEEDTGIGEEDAEKNVSPTNIEEKVEENMNSLEIKCVNPECANETPTYYQADRTTAAFYSLTRRRVFVCEQCRLLANERSEDLIKGIKDLRPFLELNMDAPSQQLVEISDSDSEGEVGDETDYVGDADAEFIENNLIDIFNQTWTKYKMESRLKDTETYLMNELDKIEADAGAIDAMLNECQKTTDAIRLDFYKDYEPRRKSLVGIVIHDTPFSSYSHIEKDIENCEFQLPTETFGNRYPKRRAATAAAETPAKRPAIPLGYAPLDGDNPCSEDQMKPEDDKEDISVVKLSAESAPADLPPSGEIVRPPLKMGMVIYAMRNAFGTWLKGRIMEVQPKTNGQQFTQCRVKFEHKVKNPCKVLAARCLAYPDPSEVRMTIGTRVVALFKDPHNTTRRESFYSGVVAEIPNPVNSYRYLVFFDDGYAQYVRHQDTRIVCESSNLVWEEVHPFIRDFICKYLLSYPERPMVRLHAGEKLKTEWNGKWWDSKVLKVDASIALIHFEEDNRTEWIYRGSTRLAPLYLELQAAEKAGESRTKSRAPRSKAQMRSNMPCVEYTRSDEQAKMAAEVQALRKHKEEMRRLRAVAKKSTTSHGGQSQSVVVSTPNEGIISRVVYYTPKNAVKPYKMTTHACSTKCRRSDLLSLKELRTYNPLSKPLLSAWERQTVRHKYHRNVFYRAPCGRRIRNMAELHTYLTITQSELSVDLFDFTPGTHCLSEFVLNKWIVSKKDLSEGKENVPVPCVNYYDHALPYLSTYKTERTPTIGVPLNLDPEFLCGCDCTDDCADKTKCACWKLTLEGARTIGMDGPKVGYQYRRLPEPLPSGIYECNSRCKCKQTCMNRVAQHPLQIKLQVFKTINRGWGIRALNDVPKGAFICVYVGNLLTDATANVDGVNEGDEYLAELDYIEVVEAMKEGYETDVIEENKKSDKKADSDTDSTSESEEEKDASKRDGDFQPGYILNSELLVKKKSLRKREKAKKKEEEKQIEAAKKNDCITISDDEEVREPSRFTARAGMVDKDLLCKQSSRVSVRALYGKDEACYIMDAKVQGNIGRYLNHSCHPNVFVQNVFVDTHDPRFPWVAFFALSLVRAGSELTWNYNYDIGSVPEKVLYCYCGAPNCRGRLL